MKDELLCKTQRIYNPWAKWIVLLLILFYVMVHVYYFTHFTDAIIHPIIGKIPLLYFSGFFILFIAFIPLTLSMTNSKFIFKKDEIIEYRGYVFGLFKIPEIHTQWSEIEAWDYEFNDSNKYNSKTWSIILFFKNKTKIHLDNYDFYLQNGRIVDWKDFHKKLKTLFVEISLPKKDYQIDESDVSPGDSKPKLKDRLIGIAIVTFFGLIVLGFIVLFGFLAVAIVHKLYNM
jgi:hypothetical protein